MNSLSAIVIKTWRLVMNRMTNDIGIYRKINHFIVYGDAVKRH